MEQLRECPFCGGEPNIGYVMGEMGLEYRVWCSKDGTHRMTLIFPLAACDSEEIRAAVVSRWNQRAGAECTMEYDPGLGVNTKDALDTWFCSECGSPVYNDCMPYYCIYCGAKVRR